MAARLRLLLVLVPAIFATAASGAQAAGCPNESLRSGASASLPDCRAYEMVSPADQAGQDLVATPFFGFDYAPILSRDGDAASFESYGAFANPNSNGVVNDYLARRTPEGWSTVHLNPRIDPNPFLPTTAAEGFTADLATSVFLGPWFPQPGPGGNEGTSNLWLRDNEGGAFRLVSVGAPENAEQVEWQPIVLSADGSHVVFGTPGFGNPIELTPDSAEAVSPFLYDWDAAAGAVTLIGRLPDETVSPNPVRLAGPTTFAGGFNPAHPVSDDGSRIYFETLGHGGTEQLFVRIGETETQEASKSQRAVADTSQPARLWSTSADGALAFFTSAEKLTDDATTGPGDEGQDLYRYDARAEALTDLTPDAGEAAEGGAQVQGVLGGSEDGSRLYFVALGALDGGATAGQNNLYVWSEGDGIEFIASGDSTVFPNNWGGGFEPRASRISPDGMHLAFTAANSLTGYPNEGNPEIYLYSAASQALDCASCNPSGAPATSGAAIAGGTENVGTLSGNLSDDGRFLFFNSAEALVPRDVNHADDAYEFDSASGAVSLISTGLSAQGSRFTDASPSGRDVLLLTREQLVGSDGDESSDAYDARIGGGIAAQQPAAPAVPCTGFADCRTLAPAATGRVTGSNTLASRGNLPPRRECGGLTRKAAALSRRARRLRNEPRGSKAAQGLAKRAAKLRQRAKQCRSENGGASR